MELPSIESIAHSGGVPELARKGTNAPHYMRSAPNMLGSWTVETVCGRALGSSRDAEIDMGVSVPGTLCKRCAKIYAAVLEIQAAGTDNAGDSSAPAAREITPAEVTEIVKVSSRANKRRRRSVAVEIERDRLATQGAERAARELSQMAAGPERDRAVRDVWESAEIPGTDVIASTGKPLDVMIAETAAFYANGGTVDPKIAPLLNMHAVNLGTGTVAAGDASVMPCEFTGPVPVINPEKTHGKCPGCTAYIPLLPERDARESGPKISKFTCESVGSAPVSGTRVMRDDHTVKVADDYDGKHSGKCPGCSRLIAVSREGGMRKHNGVTAPEAREESPDRIGGHNVGGVATPAGKGLTSRSVDTVEHGSVPGDTATANKRRQDESRCKRGNKVLKDASGGKVPCPECARVVELLKVTRPNGDIAWNIPHHVRPGESVKHVGRGDVRDVTPRGEGSDVGTVRGTGHGRATAVKGARLALSRGHGSVDGVANTGSQNMAPVRPGGWLGTAGTGQLPATVRPGVDPCVPGDICPLPECKGERKDIAHKGKKASWRRRHSAKLGAWHAGRDAARKAAREAKIESGEILAAPVKRAARKAASVGSFSEGNVNGTVTHAARPEFEPKGTRKPAPNRKGGGKHTVRDGKAE